MGELTDLNNRPVTELREMAEIARKESLSQWVHKAGALLEDDPSFAKYHDHRARLYARVSEILTDLASVRDGAFCEECGALYDLHDPGCSRVRSRYCGECGAHLAHAEDHHERCTRGQA